MRRRFRRGRHRLPHAAGRCASHLHQAPGVYHVAWSRLSARLTAARTPEERMSTVAVRWSDDVRRSYSQLIGTMLGQGAGAAAQSVSELAVQQEVWRHPLQRPVHYHPSLDPVSVYDPADYWFCGYLEENYPQIRAELDAVTDPASAGFLPVEEPLLGAGRWQQVTFYEAGHRFDDACERFPITASVIDAIPEAAAAGTGVVTLSWLYPGTHIVPHCGGTNARLRVHLGLRVPEGP